jgi:hypothetical protein
MLKYIIGEMYMSVFNFMTSSTKLEEIDPTKDNKYSIYINDIDEYNRLSDEDKKNKNLIITGNDLANFLSNNEFDFTNSKNEIKMIISNNEEIFKKLNVYNNENDFQRDLRINKYLKKYIVNFNGNSENVGELLLYIKKNIVDEINVWLTWNYNFDNIIFKEIVLSELNEEILTSFLLEQNENNNALCLTIKNNIKDYNYL